MKDILAINQCITFIMRVFTQLLDKKNLKILFMALAIITFALAIISFALQEILEHMYNQNNNASYLKDFSYACGVITWASLFVCASSATSYHVADKCCGNSTDETKPLLTTEQIQKALQPPQITNDNALNI